MRKGFLLTVVLVLASGWLYGQTIPITNHSFESPDLNVDGAWCGPSWSGGGASGSCAIPGWTITGGQAGVWDPAVGQSSEAFVGGIPDGDQVAYSNAGDLAQATGATVTPGYRYALKVSVGGRPSLSGKPYAVILAGDTALSSETGVNVVNEWFTETVTYNSPIGDSHDGETIKVKLVNEDGVQLNFDKVSLVASRVLTCEGFLSPFDKALILKKKENRAIPVKMVLRDLLDNVITDADLSAPPVVQVSVGVVSGDSIENYDGNLLPPGLSDDGNEFRYDWASLQWIINLATKQYTGSLTYNVTVVPGDDSYVIDGCTQTFTRQ